MRLGGELHGPAQGLLGLALGRGDVAQQHDMAGIDAKGARRSFHSRVEWKPSWDSRKATPGTRR
jgi:hypothetical protein